jgi:hypothetical protein
VSRKERGIGERQQQTVYLLVLLSTVARGHNKSMGVEKNEKNERRIVKKKKKKQRTD